MANENVIVSLEDIPRPHVGSVNLVAVLREAEAQRYEDTPDFEMRNHAQSQRHTTEYFSGSSSHISSTATHSSWDIASDGSLVFKHMGPAGGSDYGPSISLPPVEYKSALRRKMRAKDRRSHMSERRANRHGGTSSAPPMRSVLVQGATRAVLASVGVMLSTAKASASIFMLGLLLLLAKVSLFDRASCFQ